ncbi:MAG: hypothetical protein IJI14_00130 [Anaerolineaceae bacterium]|nr:hypothetical protein [Anaerolineaceae bacterium]
MKPARGQARKAAHAQVRGIMARIIPLEQMEAAAMDINILSQLIANMGFPIACVIAMFWSWNKEREDHKQELEQITTALNNNTQALIKIEALIRDELKK